MHLKFLSCQVFFVLIAGNKLSGSDTSQNKVKSKGKASKQEDTDDETDNEIMEPEDVC